MLEPAVADRLAHCGKRIVITGAGGWLGMATLELVSRALGDGFATQVSCFGGSRRTLVLRDGTKIEQRPLAEVDRLAREPTILLHFAFLTKDRVERMSEGDYRRSNRAITDRVIGALDATGVEAVFVASSGAAARCDDPAADAALRLYGALKRDEEQRFADWAHEHARRAVIARIFNLTGPYINKHQAYAIANFILDGAAGATIRVKAPRPVIRGFVAIRELMSLAFALLLAEPDGVVRFDSGGEPLELDAVARQVAAAFPGGRHCRAAITEDAQDRYCGDGAAYTALLAAHGIAAVALREQIEETIAYLTGTPAQDGGSPPFAVVTRVETVIAGAGEAAA